METTPQRTTLHRIEPITNKIRQKRISINGHTLRMPQTRIAKQILQKLIILKYLQKTFYLNVYDYLSYYLNGHGRRNRYYRTTYQKQNKITLSKRYQISSVQSFFDNCHNKIRLIKGVTNVINKDLLSLHVWLLWCCFPAFCFFNIL